MMVMRKYKQVPQEKCRKAFDLFRERIRHSPVKLNEFCSACDIPYWVMRRWMRNNNETVRQARTGIPAKARVRMPDMGIGFYCIDWEGTNPYRIIFRILPFEAVVSVGKMMISMSVCRSCQVDTSTDTYRSGYVSERIELKLEGYSEGFPPADLSRICREVSFALGYELYELRINDLINLKVKTAFEKRKRYI